jgi:uncharacterized membrane protein YebE (DUF533 family)
MKIEHMIDEFAKTIQETFINTWKHDGYIDRTYKDKIDFEIDNKHYSLTIECMENKNEND